mmetsp:Transcript_4895/g.433  ORF Transcript_4895/g.433 Transcript_4895/m.433 type:complete len:109 (-) Transcript_4895:146-472(-)
MVKLNYLKCHYHLKMLQNYHFKLYLLINYFIMYFLAINKLVILLLFNVITQIIIITTIIMPKFKLILQVLHINVFHEVLIIQINSFLKYPNFKISNIFLKLQKLRVHH